MKEKVKSSTSITSGINSILERISNFFHIFDFPFFVSGFVILGIFFFFNIGEIDQSSYFLSGWLGILSILIASYVLGLISFSAGRVLNKIFRRRVLKNTFSNSIEKHHLEKNEQISAYLSSSESDDKKNNDKETKNDDENWHLYARLWQDLIRYRPNSLTVNHLSRYWALAALYDSLSFSFLLWSSAFFISRKTQILSTSLKSTTELILGLSCLVFVGLALYQGCRYYKYQIVDLVASTATEDSKIIH